MKKFSILTATISLLLIHGAFADPTQMPADAVQATATQHQHTVVTSHPVDAVNVADDGDGNSTSPLMDPDLTTEDESVIINDHLKAVPRMDHDEDAEYHYTMDMTYPQITGDNISQEAEQFNQIISKMVKEQVDQFKNSVKLDAVHMNTLPAELRKNTFKIDYDIDVIK